MIDTIKKGDVVYLTLNSKTTQKVILEKKIGDKVMFTAERGYTNILLDINEQGKTWHINLNN